MPSFQLVSISVPHATPSLVLKNKLHIPPGIDMLIVGLVLHDRVVIEGSGRKRHAVLSSLIPIQ